MIDLIKNDFWAALANAEESFWAAEEQLGEVTAEYRSECYAFGDAWPGACADIEEYQNIVDARRDIYESLEAQLAA